jgi:hypothetical protein
MTPQEVWNYYGSSYQFHKKTGMSNASIVNWMKWGFVPENSQYKLERLTNGVLKPSIVVKKNELDINKEAYSFLKNKIAKCVYDFFNKYPELYSEDDPKAPVILFTVFNYFLKEYTHND